MLRGIIQAIGCYDLEIASAALNITEFKCPITPCVSVTDDIIIMAAACIITVVTRIEPQFRRLRSRIIRSKTAVYSTLDVAGKSANLYLKVCAKPIHLRVVVGRV